MAKITWIYGTIALVLASTHAQSVPSLEASGPNVNIQAAAGGVVSLGTVGGHSCNSTGTVSCPVNFERVWYDSHSQCSAADNVWAYVQESALFTSV